MNWYLKLVERLCEAFLQRRGRMVLPRLFIGLAVGYGTARQRKDGIWEVYVPTPPGRLIALNNAIMWRDSDELAAPAQNMVKDSVGE